MNATTVSRAEHLEWCKKRALEYCDAGDVKSALASLGSDLSKHPETEKHAAIELGTMMLMNGLLNTPSEMARFIRGFQ